MRIECPACRYAAEVDPAKIPQSGANATCPKCATLFRVSLPETAPQATDAMMTCPKCGAEQERADSCGLCGIIIAKHRVAEALRPVKPATNGAAAAKVLPAPDGTSVEAFHFGYGRDELLVWVMAGQITPADLPEAVRISGMLPGPAQWRRFLDGLTLWLGAIFLAAAVIFFFAYNWQELGAFARFAIVELLLAAAVIAAWRLGLERMAGQAALLVATLLTGALLAVVGQTYQTGADPWELFAVWALCVLPWAGISRFAPLWLLWLVLVNLAAGLYYHAFVGIFTVLYGTETLWWTLAAVNTAALAVWETAAHKGAPWLAMRWAPRMVATASAGFFTLLVVWGIVAEGSGGIGEFAGYLAWLAGAYAVYRHKIRDLFALALGVLSIIIVVAVFLGYHLLRSNNAGSFFILGMVVIGLSAAGGWWLRLTAAEVEA